jgi:hypothetical protein
VRKLSWHGIFWFLQLCCVLLPAAAQSAPQVVQLSSAEVWQRIEFKILNVPTSANPFDPEMIRVDATFALPSGKVMDVPAFWFQGYTRNLSGSTEVLSISGTPEWRLRFVSPEAGTISLAITVRTNGQVAGSVITNFAVTGSAPARFGYAQIASKQYLKTSDGRPLRLIGENLCWPGSRGTYDYDDWMPAMQSHDENHARIWMCPWAFGLETAGNSLTNYRLDAAWKLDYVFQQAEQRDIFLLLCLDYHGMFEVNPDYWGGNNYWTNNPYNIVKGGPCVNQNAFFTNATAKALYQKRLRYLIARYGYSPNLLAWQFFNEIDNVYSYLNANDVAAWHGVMGGWLHTNDPFGHLVTTSLTGGSDRPEIWNRPELDFADYHSYGEAGPSTRLAAVAQSFLTRYGKPVLIDEFGTDWRGWQRENDPYLRGLRQGLWGGALGGSVGTAMSWWWENIHSENVYPLYSAVGAILNGTGWGIATWTNIGFRTSGAPPVLVGDVISGGQPFNVTLPLSGGWAAMLPGRLAVPDSTGANYSAANLNSFVHGTSHSDLRIPFQLSAWLTNNAKLILHLNSVSWYSTLVVKADGAELYRTNIPNRDGDWVVTNEYNIDLTVNLPAGKRLIEVTNAGQDWFFLDWVRLEQVLPSQPPGNWQPSPDAIGLRSGQQALIYVVAPGAAFPANATTTTLPLQTNQAVTLTNWPMGTFYAEWHDPATAAFVGYTEAETTNAALALSLPWFNEDLVGMVYPAPRLASLGLPSAGQFQFQLESEIGGRYVLQNSTNLSTWVDLLILTNASGTSVHTAPLAAPAEFFRARRLP